MRLWDQYTGAVRAKTGATSDYALAKVLKVTNQTAAFWRTAGALPNEATMFRAADLLRIDRRAAFLDLQIDKAERSKNAELVQVLREWRTLFPDVVPQSPTYHPPRFIPGYIEGTERKSA